MSINCILTGNKITEHDLADELMLPVQNGGLYINSETTQEDKAEAVEAIKGIGLSADDVGAPFGVNATDMSLADLLNYATEWNYPFVFAIQYNSAIAPSTDSCIGVGIRDMLYAFNNVGKVYYCNNADTGWRPIDFLPLGGSVPMSGELPMNGNTIILSPYSNWNDGVYNVIDENDNGLQFRVSHATVTRGFYFNNVNLPLSQAINIWDAPTARTYQIFGEHNKPSGSYTGNGSATSRTIPLSGIGSIVYVWSLNGWAIITKKGGIGKGSSTTTLENFKYTEALGDESGIVLATANWLLNENGIKYYYQYL